MKILQVINNLGSGGAEKLLVDFVPYLEKAGNEVEVVLLQHSGSVHLERALASGIKVTWLTENSIYSMAILFRLRKRILAGKYDIVHAHLFPSLYFVAFAKILGEGSTRLFFTEHSTHNRRMSNIFFKIVDRMVYSNYSVVVCITEKVKNSLKCELGKTKSKLVVIPNGIVLSDFQTPIFLNRKDIDERLNENDVLLTMVGRFCYPKNQKAAIEALLYLPTHVKLLLIGDGPRRHEHERLVEDLQLNDRVIFGGIRNDISQILRVSDIGLLSSDYEGMPLSVLEIMASKIPFVGSRVIGIEELVQNNGLLFEHSNSLELAKKVKFLMENSVAKEEYIQKAWEYVQAYSIQTMAKKYCELYEDLLI